MASRRTCADVSAVILLRVTRPGLSRLRPVFGNRADTPVAWRNSAAVAAGMLVSGALGLVFDHFAGGQTFLVSLITGMFLGLIAVTGPFFMALRLILGVGILVTLAAGLAVVALDHAWLAVVGIVVLVFVGTVWTAIPLVGGLLGSFPTLVYLMILAQGPKLTGGGIAGRVMLGAVVGIVGALVVLLLFSGGDPRKATRGLVAGSWGADSGWQQQGAVLTVLRLDAAPRAYVSLVQAAIVAMIARNRLGDQQETDTYRQALAAQKGLATTILPRGAMVPRAVPDSVEETRGSMQDRSRGGSDRIVSYAWDRWQAAIGYGCDVLAGHTPPRKVAFSTTSLTGDLIRSVLHPESASFRYGIQRTLALGVATFVMLSTSLPDFYWVVLTIFSVMQTNAVATLARAAQYAVGTWVGATAAVALSLVLPAPVLGFLAVALLAVGFAWMVRNYLIMCVAIAVAVVLLVGSPDGQYLQWAGLRALDCTAGALIAVAVSAFVLRVRPLPTRHVTQARDALVDTIGYIRRHLDDGAAGGATEPVLAGEGRFMRAMANLRADVQLLRDPEPASAALTQLSDANDEVLALGSVVFEGPAGRADPDWRATRDLIGNGLAHVEHKVRAIEAPLDRAGRHDAT